jgi:RNA polymerase sigma factor (sigma-70 family)
MRSESDTLSQIFSAWANSAMNANSATNQTLMRRLKDPSDEAAKVEFFDRYSSTIFRWCCRHGLQEADAEDVAQIVVMNLLARYQIESYEPRSGKRFRAWLGTVVANAVNDAFRAIKNRPVALENADVLESVEARQNLDAGLERHIDHELFDEAVAQVLDDESDANREIWKLRSQGIASKRVAEMVPMTPGAVDKAFERMKGRIKSKYVELNSEGDS